MGINKIFSFAFCAEYDRKISSLANLCPEKWSFGAHSDNIILKNYIDYTFQKLCEDKSVLEKDQYAVFNTGLFTSFYEPIYAYFTNNKIPNRQKWFLEGFNTKYQLCTLGVDQFPPRANYFTNPGALVFDTNCEIIPQYQHIFNDPENYSRIPESVRESTNKSAFFDGAIAKSKCMIDANYKTAVPQYYKGRIQLLIPLCLVNVNVPDLALVVSKNEAGTQYLGHTCLTLEMAYNNARLIAKPNSDWLRP